MFGWGCCDFWVMGEVLRSGRSCRLSMFGRSLRLSWLGVSGFTEVFLRGWVGLRNGDCVVFRMFL